MEIRHIRYGIPGVYCITNTVTGEKYIGSSTDIRQRMAAHKSNTTHNQRPNSKLYQAMKQYGTENFTCEILTIVDISGMNKMEAHRTLVREEQKAIEFLKPEYNLVSALRERIYYEPANPMELCPEWKERNNQMQKQYAISEEKRKRYEMRHRICIYNGEEMTFSALESRFYYKGVKHPTKEAKKYLKK